MFTNSFVTSHAGILSEVNVAKEHSESGFRFETPAAVALPVYMSSVSVSEPVEEMQYK